VPNGVDLERFRPDPAGRRAARAKLGVREGTALVGVVGQITPWKGQADAIEAVSLVGQRHPSILLLVVGSVKFAGSRHDNHEYLAALHRRVAELGLGGRVRFLGEREDIPQLLRALDILLVPSWEEPFGRVVIEGMAVSTPVLATAVGGPAEVIEDGDDGILLPPRQPRRWADAIDALLADPDRRLALGCQARHTVEARFDEAQHATRITGFYSQLTQEVR
jgi:glycosyltransferase involved in cell wall biosynthesis